jgi:hypothetical protein
VPNLLKSLIATFGAVCIAISLVHVTVGPSAIPGSIPVNATMDSEHRFYTSLFLGFGAALIWCSRNLDEREMPFKALLLVFFVGGLARCMSAMQVGMPSNLFQFLWALELILPPLFWFWHRHAFPK